MNGVTQELILEQLRIIFLITIIVLILGLLLEHYLLNKKSKYSIFIPLFFLIYPIFRTPIILRYEVKWAYKLPELVYIFTPFVIIAAYFVLRKNWLNKKEPKRNKEIDKLKIQDL